MVGRGGGGEVAESGSGGEAPPTSIVAETTQLPHTQNKEKGKGENVTEPKAKAAGKAAAKKEDKQKGQAESPCAGYR